ncbi:acetyltransferase [Flavobacterium silvisoli]|uniref:Acetyltransferase n=1 Tax=Flavobacterium silvisoli TaxID=2529433 RepID=A0A4Q9YZ82_9FLAO|nr:acetyltransferase [Flavobacterium silvisoli]TBX69263.1 acetyltransferase [Flavobacterium silvisoli]
MENKVNLYGASGHCKVIVDILHSINKVVGTILDDNPKSTELLGYAVQKSDGFLFDKASQWILSIGNNKVRKRLADMNLDFVNLIHHKAIVSPHSAMGKGNVVMAGAIINPGATVGNHCIINTGAVIEHDCIIEDFAHVSPSVALAGGVRVGEGTHVGIGASVIQGVQIGKWAVIGAGAVILKDVPDFSTVVGNPGRIIKYTNQHE